MPASSEWIIKDQTVVSNSWRILEAEVGVDELADMEQQAIIVPLDFWLTERSILQTRKGLTGVWLDSNEKPGSLIVDSTFDINDIPLIAVNFPVFSDGRGYSTARALRQNLGYKGDLMAIGDVLRDQVFFLKRCGFNILMPRADQDAEIMLTAFADFKTGYQASIDQPEPLFRRR